MERVNFKEKIFLFLLYTSLLIGFYFEENLNYGSYLDWVRAYNPVLEDFSKDFKNTLLEYDSYGQRHSPVYIIFLSIFLKLGLSFDFIRLIHLHISLSLILIFYSCLKLKFKDTNRIILRILALSIFLSPTFRSLAIWPDSRMPGLIFFILSIYFFLKFLLLAKNQKKFAWYTLISIIISSYISPNFSLFFIFFIYYFFQKLNLQEFLLLILFSFIASIPMIYYIFFLDINFITAGKTPLGSDSIATSLSFNISNKILIISSIILFHLIPVLYFLLDKKKIILFFKKKIILILISFSILAYFFNYQLAFTGGGFFFQLSQILFNNNLIFFIISFFSFFIIMYLSTLHKDNFILIFLLILSNLQNTIYHKYYEPLILIIIFVLFKNLDHKNFFSNKINLIYLYGFSFFYISIRVYKNIYLI